MMSSPIADMFTRLRNALAVKKPEIILPSSTMKLGILKILKDNSYVKNFEQIDDPNIKNGKLIKVELGYDALKRPAIHKITVISKPGRRVYSQREKLPVVLDNIGIAIISTSQGLMTNKDARKRRLGGEVICEIY